MRKIIYKLFFMPGICASAFGLTNSAQATTPTEPTNTQPFIKATDKSGKLYFTDVISSNADSNLYAAHYSHRSHSSHSSHSSHYSHVSSR